MSSWKHLENANKKTNKKPLWYESYSEPLERLSAVKK